MGGASYAAAPFFRNPPLQKSVPRGSARIPGTNQFCLNKIDVHGSRARARKNSQPYSLRSLRPDDYSVCMDHEKLDVYRVTLEVVTRIGDSLKSNDIDRSLRDALHKIQRWVFQHPHERHHAFQLPCRPADDSRQHVDREHACCLSVLLSGRLTL
jgi:hypothetical protein